MTTSDGGPDRTDPLTRIRNLSPTVVMLATLALFLGVLLLPDPVGAALVLLLAAGLGWLLARTWPVLATSARAIRLVVIALLVAVAATKLFA